jgi:hypothetical protein
VLRTFREHSGNIQGTFREHSGNMQGTFREHSGNIQGTCREHLGRVVCVYQGAAMAFVTALVMNAQVGTFERIEGTF